jgi:plasmid stabilization system protein ParE
MEKEIIWSDTAQKQLKKIYTYLSKKSRSEDVSNTVIDKIYNSVTI